MQPKVPGLVAITCMAFVVGCDADLFSPRLRSAAEQARAARNAGAETLTTFAVSANEIDLSWQDNSLNEIGWEVHRSTTGSAGVFTLLATLPTGATSYADTGLTQLTQYCYKVRSFRKVGPTKRYESFFSTSCNTTPAAPAPPPAPEAPSDLSVRPVVGAEVEVTWSYNSSADIGFSVYRSVNAGPFEVLLHAYGIRNFIVPVLGNHAEQQVCYKVAALNSTSGFSNVDCTTPPERPSDLVARSLDAQSIDLTWRDNSAVEDGYEVRRADASLVFVSIATLPANATTYHDASITPDVRLSYEVRAMKDGGFSYSAFASAFSVSRPPDAPTSAHASPHGSSAVRVLWSNADNTEGNRIERSLDGGSSWTMAGSTNPSPYENSFTDTGRSSEQQACYRVFAVNSVGESPASNTSCTTPPAAATNFSTTHNESDDYLDLRWTDNSGVEDAYVVLVSSMDVEYNIFVWEAEWLPPGTESYRLFNASSYTGPVLTVVAAKDGGYSDYAAAGAASASQTATLRASMPRGPWTASRSGRPVKPLDARLSSPKKLRR